MKLPYKLEPNVEPEYEFDTLSRFKATLKDLERENYKEFCKALMSIFSENENKEMLEMAYQEYIDNDMPFINERLFKLLDI